MASSADRMAAGAGFGALAKADELKKRLWFTVGALIIYRLGTYLPLPGIDPGALADIFSQQSSGILGMFDMFRRGTWSDDNFCAKYHALYYGIDYHAANDRDRAFARSLEKGW